MQQGYYVNRTKKLDKGLNRERDSQKTIFGNGLLESRFTADGGMLILPADDKIFAWGNPLVPVPFFPPSRLQAPIAHPEIFAMLHSSSQDIIGRTPSASRRQ